MPDLTSRDAQAAVSTFWVWTSRLRHCTRDTGAQVHRCTGARPLVSCSPGSLLHLEGEHLVVGACPQPGLGYLGTYLFHSHSRVQSISGQPLPPT